MVSTCQELSYLQALFQQTRLAISIHPRCTCNQKYTEKLVMRLSDDFTIIVIEQVSTLQENVSNLTCFISYTPHRPRIIVMKLKECTLCIFLMVLSKSFISSEEDFTTYSCTLHHAILQSTLLSLQKNCKVHNLLIN